MEDKEISKQHSKLPNNMAKDGLTPKDQIVYVGLRSFMNNDTQSCYPSLQKLSERIGASTPTIRESLKRLKEAGYIEIEKKGRGKLYKFKKITNHECFSNEFLEKEDVSFIEKAYIASAQQYMFKDTENYGKLSFSNAQLSELINLPESTISRTNRSLEKKNYLTIVDNESRDLETGCKTKTKVFKLADLGQAIIWKLKEHEDRISKNELHTQENSDKIKKLEHTVETQQKMIDALLRERNIEPEKYTL